MKKGLLKTMTFVLLPITALLMLLPQILHRLGLHPEYEKQVFNFEGKKALIITTSTDTLGVDGAKTGVYASEMTVPYYEFLEANMTVDLASIKGGVIPIEANSLRYPLATEADKRFLEDKTFLAKATTSICIDDVEILDYDIIFMAGGWGAAYDLGTCQSLGEKITQANKEKIILGSVCHGALGFIKAEEINGEPLVKGKLITGVTNKQIKELNITITPMHPETELKKLGALYQSKSGLVDVLTNLTVVDGHIVTGQNQNAGGETAQKMLQLLSLK